MFAGISCGIKDKGQKDLGLILSKSPDTKIAGIFTKNKICAAPVKVCKQNLKAGVGQMVVINSGIANAATGKKGLTDAQKMCEWAGKIFSLRPDTVFPCSTGKIGPHLPMEKIKKGIRLASMNLSLKGFADCSQAICTTDAFTKTVWTKGVIQGKPFTMAVMAKGAGMIHPDMATMLSFVMTDLKIARPILQGLLKEAASETLNSLSVDGDTSTNDTVLMMANGWAKNRVFQKSSVDYKKVKSALVLLLESITQLIAMDGEGATKCFCVHVCGARSVTDAKKVAKAISKSLLVKTALFGSDPNWGRILCAVGYSGARVLEEKTKIKIGPHAVFSKGNSIPRNEKLAAQYLNKNSIVDLFVDLGLGKSQAKAYGCDLSHDYITLNAEYRT